MGVRFLYNFDSWDAATITSSSEASTDLADDNIIHDHVGKVWRTTGKASEWIKFDLGSAKQITCFGMFNFNLTSGATVTLQAHTSDSWGTPDYSQALTIVTDSDSVVLKRIVFFLDQTKRWWRVTLADAANTATYLEVGRMVGGAYHEPSRNFNEGYRIMMVDPSEGEKIPGRQTFFRTRNRFRQAAVGFGYMDQTQTDKFTTIFTKVGTSEPLVLALDPTSRPSQDSMYCYLQTPLDLVNQLVSQYGTGILMFEEKTE